METIENKEVTIYNNAIETFRNGGEILARSQATVSKAITAGQSLLLRIEQNDGKLNPELDTLANDYLVKISKRKSELEEARKPVTQMMDTVKKFFTSEEAKLDVKSSSSIPFQIQQHRNSYAKEQAEIEKKRQEEAAAKAAKDREKVQLIADSERQLNDYFIGHLLSYKQQMNAGFNAITLQNFDEKEQKLNALPCQYQETHFKAFSPNLRPLLHKEEEKWVIIAEAMNGKFDGFSAQFSQETSELKQQLIDRLSSKKLELEQFAAAEKARLEEEARAVEAERKRKEEIARADGERKKQLEEQAKLEAEKENARKAELAAEQQKLEEARKLREAEEADRLRREAEEAARKAEQDVEIKKVAGETMALFDQEAAVAEGIAAPETRQGYEVNVQHAAGYVQIFQFWFENEGKNLPLEKLGNTKLDQMKAWCEKHAHKNGEKIESKFLIYEETFKAVNRKTS